MRFRSKRPLYIGGVVVEGDLTVTESHGKELVRKGYAVLIESDAPAKTIRKRKPKSDKAE